MYNKPSPDTCVVLQELLFRGIAVVLGTGWHLALSCKTRVDKHLYEPYLHPEINGNLHLSYKKKIPYLASDIFCWGADMIWVKKHEQSFFGDSVLPIY